MSVGVVVAIVVGGIAVLAAVIIWMTSRFGRDNKRAEEAVLGRLRAEIPKRGWTYAERDDSFCDVFNAQPQFSVTSPLEPLVGRPKALRAHHVITGVHRGRPFFVAQFDVQHKGQVFPVGATWMRLPAMRPWLSVARVVETQSRVRAAIGQGDIEFGHPGFDDRFQVDSESEQFARAVITPQVATFLTNAPKQVTGCNVYGDHFDVQDIIRDRRDPAELVPALDLRCDLLDLIPARVWS